MACILIAAIGRSHADPFPTVDQNPLLRDLGLSAPHTARVVPNGTTAGIVMEWSSVSALQQSAREELVADAESREWRIDLQHSISERVAVRVQLPYRIIDGGTLDGFIDDWHQFFGQSEGDRPLFGKNALLIDYRRDSAIRLRIDEEITSVGDLQIAMGYQLIANTSNAVAMWSGVKLPTGDDEQLSRNQWSAYTTFAGEHALSSRWRTFGQVGVIYARQGGRLEDMQQEWIAQGMVGLDYLASDALTFTLQLDAHTAAYRDTPLELLGHAWILTAGGRYKFENDWQVQMAVGEDIKVEASPDVNFLFAISKTWR
jgi:hypothetical protein